MKTQSSCFLLLIAGISDIHQHTPIMWCWDLSRGLGHARQTLTQLCLIHYSNGFSTITRSLSLLLCSFPDRYLTLMLLYTISNQKFQQCFEFWIASSKLLSVPLWAPWRYRQYVLLTFVIKFATKIFTGTLYLVWGGSLVACNI